MDLQTSEQTLHHCGTLELPVFRCFCLQPCLTAGLSDVLQSGTQEFLQRTLLLLVLPAGQTVTNKPQTLVSADRQKSTDYRSFQCDDLFQQLTLKFKSIINNFIPGVTTSLSENRLVWSAAGDGSRFVLLQDFQSVVLDAQLVSVTGGGLQLGVQLCFDLQRDAQALPFQKSSSPALEMLQMPVQSLEILRLSHRQTWDVTVWKWGFRGVWILSSWTERKRCVYKCNRRNVDELCFL